MRCSMKKGFGTKIVLHGEEPPDVRRYTVGGCGWAGGRRAGVITPCRRRSLIKAAQALTGKEKGRGIGEGGLVAPWRGEVTTERCSSEKECSDADFTRKEDEKTGRWAVPQEGNRREVQGVPKHLVD